MAKDYLKMVRDGEKLSGREQFSMIFRLSLPTMLAQISSVIMQYIDASMVGRLGPNDSASIGLVSSSTWLIWGVSAAICTGFTVMIAKKIGARDEKTARDIAKTGIFFSLLLGIIVAVLSAAVSGILPALLAGNEDIRKNASVYFLVFSISLPIFQLNTFSIGMIQCSGNMKMSGIAETIICVLDVIYNMLLIFPVREYIIAGHTIKVYGADLGVLGAALGSSLAELTVVIFLLYYLIRKSPVFRIRRDEKPKLSLSYLRAAIKIALPIAAEQLVTCSAYIAITRIVSPLGTIALAANSFSITAESLCYMPGFGISSASSTIIGQSIGARRSDLTGKLGRNAVISGVGVMAICAVLMYISAPTMLSLLSPDPEIQQLGVKVLRIEAFAEPLYAAAIVSTGVFRGAGDTIVPTSVNLICMWMIRIPFAAFLSVRLGLEGVWIAMCTELCIRGLLFIILLSTRFKRKVENNAYIVEV